MRLLLNCCCAMVPLACVAAGCAPPHGAAALSPEQLQELKSRLDLWAKVPGVAAKPVEAPGEELKGGTLRILPTYPPLDDPKWMGSMPPAGDTTRYGIVCMQTDLYRLASSDGSFPDRTWKSSFLQAPDDFAGTLADLRKAVAAPDTPQYPMDNPKEFEWARFAVLNARYVIVFEETDYSDAGIDFDAKSFSPGRLGVKGRVVDVDRQAVVAEFAGQWENAVENVNFEYTVREGADEEERRAIAARAALSPLRKELFAQTWVGFYREVQAALPDLKIEFYNPSIEGRGWVPVSEVKPEHSLGHIPASP